MMFLIMIRFQKIVNRDRIIHYTYMRFLNSSEKVELISESRGMEVTSLIIVLFRSLAIIISDVSKHRLIKVGKPIFQIIHQTCSWWGLYVFFPRTTIRDDHIK